MASRGGGRDRFRPRFEDKTYGGGGGGGGRSNAPPSRHLWVGNLSHNIEEADLTDQLLRFGELQSVAFQPGRSYAFVNFISEEDAIAAMKALQGFPLAGNPLKIEFAKADKSSTPSYDHPQQRDEARSTLRGSPFGQRDSRLRHASSPDPLYPDKSKMGDRNAEPSEVLWIGFPASLKVDEFTIRKAFSPFGEVEKITVFPGRSYAFVRFRSITSACRAKETLQGKLFGNPRVHICFAKSDGSSNTGRSSMNPSLSSHLEFDGRDSSSEIYRPERSFGHLGEDPNVRSPLFFPGSDTVDVDAYNVNNRKGALWSGGNNQYEPWGIEDGGPQLGLSQDMYEQHSSPIGERPAQFHDFPQKFPQKGQFYEEPWEAEEEDYYYPGPKKMKTGSFPPDQDLPEYPLSALEQEKRVFSKTYVDFSQQEAFDKTFDTGNIVYKPSAEPRMNSAIPHIEKRDHRKAPYGSQVGSGSLPPNLHERIRLTPETDQASLIDWKWEGTIAKGGTPVCHARCFPVGKVMDFMLPEFLDCTARTSLDMLSKHYYQASAAWVVFFVPGSDADIGYYNEFLHYLEEKQRAAVAKLDEENTLFLVPPSDFSQKVLKVPGKLSISGVVLRMEHPGSSQGSLHHQNEMKDPNLIYPNTSTPSRTYFPQTSFRDMGDPAISAAPNPYPAMGNISNSHSEKGREYLPHQRNQTNWSPHHLQNPVSGTRNTSSIDLIPQGQSFAPRNMQEASSTSYTSGIPSMPSSETKPSASLPLPFASLQPDQIAQLASSLFGQQRQTEITPNANLGDNNPRQPAIGHNQSDSLYRPSQSYASQNSQMSSEHSASHIGQGQQQLYQPQQQAPIAPVPQGIQQQQSSDNLEADGDPQKRLQATLQLAAALLQQIQQGKGN